MSIFDSHETGVRAKVRMGRYGQTAIDWSAPTDVTLHIQKNRGGIACVVAVRECDDFAEFDPRHDQESYNLFVNEDYALEVLELPLGAKWYEG